jgi:DNA-binding NtrC family response regulator
MARVLICQCAERMARELAAALAEEGIGVIPCPEGDQLVETTLREQPDAVIHVLREDPHEDLGLLRLVRRAAPEIPLILLAESGSLEIQRQLIELRPIFYDVVPVGPEDLLDAVRSAIERGAATQKPRPADLRPPRI